MAFCGNCGTQYNQGTRFCPTCGLAAGMQSVAPAVNAQPPQPAAYVGYAPPPQAYPNYAPPPQPMPYGGSQVQPGHGRKSKTTAIILAFIFGPISWIYTFKKDGVKLGLALLLGVISFVIEITTASFTIGYIMGFGVWLWAFITALTRSSEWYAAY